jgi:predicted Rossmann fold flavoprotein
MLNLNKVVVIGGGPAGMMAAISAAQNGAQVVLIEKNDQLGKKLKITGHGRGNLTNATFDLKELVKVYGNNGKFLFSALNQFGPQETMDFFESLGIKLKIEDHGRVFPVSDSAESVVKTLEAYLKKLKVKILLDSEVEELLMTDDAIVGVKLTDRKIIESNSFIVTTGGMSYAVTGSTGAGYDWAKKTGHAIVNPRPALVPLKAADAWVKKLSGVSRNKVEISLNKKVVNLDGELLFTHFGISGPLVLKLSKHVTNQLADGNITITMNLFPEIAKKNFDSWLLKQLRGTKKSIKAILAQSLPEKLVAVLLDEFGVKNVSPDKLSKTDRFKLHQFQSLPIMITGTMGFEVAMVTSGGVDLKEIDPKTMRSKLIKNLYFAGEVLDIDGPTGGYNLQVAWSTGYAAGRAVSQ